MLTRLRPQLSYANVTATLALVIALGTGSAYAANTIRSGDIVDGQVKRADLAASAVNSAKLEDNSVSRRRRPWRRRAWDRSASARSSKAGATRSRWRCPARRRARRRWFAADGPVQSGIVMLASRVPADHQVTLNVCNHSGTTMDGDQRPPGPGDDSAESTVR